MLTQAHTPGGVLIDDTVGVRMVEVIVQGVRFFDFIAGLPKRQAGEVVVGGESRRACAENSECQQQFFESGHGEVPYVPYGFWVRGKVT
ncbi:hypothetical protein D3C81_1903530 [compost metagenome]